MNLKVQQSDEVYEALVKILGAGNVTREKHDLICYEKDFSLSSTAHMPDFAIHARTTRQVLEVVRLANRYKTPIVPRGGGTNPWGGAIPVIGGIVLDMRKMNRLLNVDKENLTVTVQAGVVMWDLVKHLEKLGFFIADKPGSWFSATIGSRTQTDGAGYYNAKYGRFIDQVICLEVVLPTGEVIKTGPAKVYDPGSGYDLTRLFSNSEGTLGIITEVTLKMHPLPEHRVVEVIEFPTYEDAVKAVADIRDSGLIPETLETMDGRQYSRWLHAIYVDPQEPYHYSKVSVLRRLPPEVAEDAGIMVVAYAGIKKLVAAQAELGYGICQKFGGNQVPDWCREALLASKGTYPHNPAPHDSSLMGKPSKYVLSATMPLERAAEVYRTYLKLVSKYNVEPRGMEAIYGAPDFHATICAQIYIDERNREEVKAARKFMDEIHRFVISLGGGTGGYGGLGMMKMQYVKNRGSALEITKKIKLLLDPNNIMNPGKKFKFQVEIGGNQSHGYFVRSEEI